MATDISLGEAQKVNIHSVPSGILIDQVNQEIALNVITKPQMDDVVSKIKEVTQEHILTSLFDNNLLNPNWAYFNQEAANIINNRLN